MILSKRLILHAGIAFVVSVAVFFLRHSALAVEPSSTKGEALRAKFSVFKSELENNPFGLPLYLESQEEYGSLHVDVYGIVDFPFGSISDAFRTPDNWCDINILLINVKACTFDKASDPWLLTLYSGRKYYQPPKDAYKLDFQFDIAALQPEYLEVALTAKNGPLYTTDHRVGLEAVPLDEGRTFIHFSYDYSYGVPARAAIKVYFATLGREKKGFSIIATDKNGDPVFAGGVRGSVERYAVRYYFGIQTYLDALTLPINQRFEQQISRWYDMTERYPRQLNELGKSEYLANKRREHNNQLLLQREADQ
jgi:hypothetical protein